MTKLKVWLIRSPILAPIAVLGVAFFSNVAYAQVSNQSALGSVLCNIINAMVWVLLAVSVIMILFAAYQYVTGGDNEEKITQARRTITWAAVGLVVALIAKGFPLLVANIVGNGTSGSSANFKC